MLGAPMTTEPLDPAAIMAKRLIRSHDTLSDLLAMAYAVRDLAAENATLREQKSNVDLAAIMAEALQDSDRMKVERDEYAAEAIAAEMEVDRLAAENVALREQIQRLVSALERTESNFRNAVNGRPVRDMSENLAENRAALDGDQPHRFPRHGTLAWVEAGEPEYPDNAALEAEAKHDALADGIPDMIILARREGAEQALRDAALRAAECRVRALAASLYPAGVATGDQILAALDGAEFVCPVCKVERADYEGPLAHLPTCPNCGSAETPALDGAE